MRKEAFKPLKNGCQIIDISIIVILYSKIIIISIQFFDTSYAQVLYIITNLY
jgi:hypothetical protein